MKKPFYIIIFVLCLVSKTALADESLSFGIGGGALYGGAGINVTKSNENDLKYIAAGILAAGESDQDNDLKAAFGLTIGWIRTDIVLPSSGRHGLGLFVGYATGSDLEDKIWVGPSYTYFFNSNDKSGFNIGISSGLSIDGGDSQVIIMPQIGFQF